MKRQVWCKLGTVSLLISFVAFEPAARAVKSEPSKTHKAAGQEKQKQEKQKSVDLGPQGLRFGLTAESVATLYDQVFTDEFLPRYRTVSPGVRMQELDQELANRKLELRRRTEFSSEPIGGGEHSPISQEFTYGNKESMTKVVLTRRVAGEDPKQKRDVKYLRRFFFFSDRLWKIYDEYKLGKLELYDSFADGVEKLTKEYKEKPQLAKADPAAHRDYEEATWVVGDTVLKLLNRQDDGHVVLVQIDKAVFDKLGTYRTNRHEAEGLSPDVAEATSKPTEKGKPGTSPADAYTRKHRQ